MTHTRYIDRPGAYSARVQFITRTAQPKPVLDEIRIRTLGDELTPDALRDLFSAIEIERARVIRTG